MATEPALHRQPCPFHDQDGVLSCSGTMKRGRGKCANKATAPSVPNLMPTCKIHRDQQRVSGQCEAKLSCGFKCGRLFAWEPYGFKLCLDHVQLPRSCYFLKIPIEMRIRIYGFLLPDKSIPARYITSRELTSDGEKVYMAILRVNHQIHEEAASFLYSTTAFTIELSGNQPHMCNSITTVPDRPMHLAPSNRSPQEYQTQLMILEQQSIRRILLAEQERNTNGGSSLNPQVALWNSSIQIQNRNHNQIFYRSTECIWHAPLSDKYFNMVRSFIIELVFPTTKPRQQIMAAPPSAAEKHRMLKSRLYDYCDDLHRLIGRLQLIPGRVAQLQIIIKLGNSYEERDEAFAAAQFLIQPLRRLQNVEKLDILSITVNNYYNVEEELLAPDVYTSEADIPFSDYLKTWSQELSSSQLSPEGSQVFEAYWQLHKLMSSIRESTNFVDSRFNQFADLLHDARVAREAEDLASFKKIWNQVISIWFQYSKAQENFRANVERSIGAIDDMVGSENETSNEFRETLMTDPASAYIR